VSELEDKISGILNNPIEMEKITQLASQFLGGGKAADDGSAKQNDSSFDFPMLDGQMLSRISSLMTSAGSGSDKANLLHAMAPYLKDSRREKMEKAMRFAKMAKIAGIAFREYGGGDV